MALIAAARGSARSAVKKAARSLSSGADVLAGSGYVEESNRECRCCLMLHRQLVGILKFLYLSL